MRTNLAFFGVLLVALAAIVLRFAAVTSSVPFAYDEADYMYAGTRGFLANYLDQPSQSLPEFIRKGMELSRDKSRRVGMSEYIRSTGDITFYRHFHGPIYAYWIAACQAVGIDSEKTYRASGLVIHALGAIVIFWLFRLVFPELGAASAFVAAIVFATNRTALVTAMSITQHVIFSFMATLSLLAVALFIRTKRRGYWYTTAALLAGAFASVEISIILVGVVVVSVVAVRWREGWKETALLIGKGTAVFFLTLLVIWPKGLLQLGIVKGYLYLAYIAIYRKTFSPIGPFDLWGFKLKTYPWEFVLLLAAFLGALVYFRRLKCRAEALPFLVYACAFFGVTMVITVPYTYYHCSLLMCLSVITGVVFGELWRRAGAIAGVIALAAIIVCGVFSDIGYYQESKKEAAADSMPSRVLAYLRTQGSADRAVFAPYILVPGMHYYFPQINATGYDKDWPLSTLAAQAVDAARGADVLCAAPVCEGLERVWAAGTILQKERIAEVKETGESFWAYQIRHY